MLHLHSHRNFKPNFEYHHDVQRFICMLLKNTSFQELHDKKGYKFFSFSNIFTNNDAQENLFNMIISSPSSKFIDQVSYQLQKIMENQIPFEIGSITFVLNECRIISKSLTFPLKIITGSPILIRIPIEKFTKQSNESMPYRSIYWRSSHPIQLFIDAIETNLRRKYYEFAKVSMNEQHLIEKFKFKKQISTTLHIDSSSVPVIGSLWEFEFYRSVSNEIQLFALDCGRKRNSLGFGFMNPIL